MDRIELLSPAGSMESFIAAINSGADAVYLGGSKFSARAYASNFNNEQMVKAIDYAHSYNVKVYVTMNTLLKQNEMKEAVKYAGYLYEIGVDALIIQDIGLINMCRNIYPDLELHGSTQMSIHNGEGALYFNEKGLKRIVLSRELSIEEIKYISKDLGIETEIFVHGALCVCYSGQCLMSSMIGGRSGNRGRCAQSCRLPYTLKGETMGIQKGYLLSTKDTCLIEDMEEIIKSKTASLKIEGRMKKPEYVAGVTRNYRKAIDKVLENKKFNVKEGKRELAKLFNRQGFAKAYLYKNVGRDMMSYEYGKNTGIFIGKVIDKGEVILEEKVELGDGIRFNDEGFTLSKILLNGKEVSEAKAGEKVKLLPNTGYKKGFKLFKMSDRKLYDQLKEYTKPYSRKISIDGEIAFKVNESVSLKTEYNGKEYKVYGDMVEEASSSPLSQERILNALEKSGDIPYKFRTIKFSAFEDGFIRISSLNNLRRQIFEKILRDNTTGYRRKRETKEYHSINGTNKNNVGIIYSCIQRSQFKALIQCNKVRNIAVNLHFSKHKQNLCKEDIKGMGSTDRNIFLKIPDIIKQDYDITINLIDEILPYIKGIVTSNAGIIHRYRNKCSIIGDYKLNIYNKEGVEFYSEDVSIPFLSTELNRKEIKELMKNINVPVGLNIYGKTELMVSEYCPIGSTFGGKTGNKSCSTPCMKDNFTLVDRMNEGFKVMCENSCRTHILNSLPLNLISEIKELQSFGIENFSIDFKDESYEEVNEILQEVYEGIRNEQKVYTKGHYKRGVE